MNVSIRLISAVLLALLAGCAGQSSQTSHSRFDLGPVPTQATAPVLPPATVQASVLSALSVADVNVPAWLDNTGMHYRLLYADSRETRPFATSHWTMPPAGLIGQRLKWRVAQAGGAVMSTADSRTNILQIDADDFSQHFDSPASSQAQVALRATVLAGRKLVAQRTFVRTAPAGGNAAGGAQALAVATDQAIVDMIQWLATLPASKALP
jgi:cholesterol transport system auxiliary component